MCQIGKQMLRLCPQASPARPDGWSVCAWCPIASCTGQPRAFPPASGGVPAFIRCMQVRQVHELLPNSLDHHFGPKCRRGMQKLLRPATTILRSMGTSLRLGQPILRPTATILAPTRIILNPKRATLRPMRTILRRTRIILRPSADNPETHVRNPGCHWHAHDYSRNDRSLGVVIAY